VAGADELGEVPDGTAVFPPIPPELNVDPLLLAVLHAVVFIAGSDEAIVHPDAGDEALAAIAGYLERLSGEERQRLLEELKALRGFAKEQGWPKQLAEFLKTFPKEFGIDA
jgi:hypothetical protein